jgi:hypothetical protein
LGSSLRPSLLLSWEKEGLLDVVLINGMLLLAIRVSS